MIWSLAFQTLVLARAASPQSADCWTAGRTRAYCCYIARRQQECFQDADTCCQASSVNLGQSVFAKLLEQLPSELFGYLQRLVQSRQKALYSPAATALTHELLKRAVVEISRAKNSTKVGELPFLGTAFRATFLYFLSLHGLRRFIPAKYKSSMMRREPLLWSGFTDVYFGAWGRRDFCRCVEAGEFFSRTNTQLAQSGIGRVDFPRTFLNDTLEHHALSAQNCHMFEEGTLHPEATLRVAFSSQCISGDIATLITLLHGCILEQDMNKVVLLHEGIFQLSTFAVDCLDARLWGFTVRDAALHFARLIWVIWTKKQTFAFDAALQRGIAWSRAGRARGETGQSATPGTGAPWNSQCGPHVLSAAVVQDPEGLSSYGSPSTHGPLCTELGRFWLQLKLQTVPPAPPESSRTLAVLPITMSWESNPWHHLHWWLPAIWYFKIQLNLSPKDVDVALVFPRADIDWAISTAEGRTLDVNFRGHTEPAVWSILQHTMPFTTEEAMKHWGPDGIHRTILGWLSEAKAKALVEFYGASYNRLIMGLPSLRFFLQTPGLTCSAIARVRHWIQSLGYFSAGAMHNSDTGSSALPAGLLKLAIIQRPDADGRRILNLDEVLSLVQTNFTELMPTVVHGLAHGTPWVDQFQQFSGAETRHDSTHQHSALKKQGSSLSTACGALELRIYSWLRTERGLRGFGLCERARRWLNSGRARGAKLLPSTSPGRSRSSPVWLQCVDLRAEGRGIAAISGKALSCGIRTLRKSSEAWLDWPAAE
ncbi:unnamed protein product [Effrenium voratum]|uniref:Uncharacterized protein n=1 Tax=Effrenium voratum TaxID=2562239 RepID=A0AA36MTM4_9DINO|nr:unnamed protein product [Effrenium voratum]